MKISFIGTGYVGLVGGVCFADKGHQVICMDNDPAKISSLKQGKVTIWEPNLEELLVKNLNNKNLSFTDDLQLAIENSDLIFFCLPTPTNEDGSADLQYVLDIASKIGKFFNGYKLIVNKSTVPVGTTKKIREVLSQSAKTDFDVVSNPEFLREGRAVQDFLYPDRIIIGASSDKAKQIMKDLYKDFINDENQLLFMDEQSSEMTKYASNSFLATKISFINQIANLCDIMGADIEQVALGMGLDPRIGHQFLKAGIGYGGSCFPKDVKALISSAESVSYKFHILEAVQLVNTNQRQLFINKILNYFQGNIKDKKLAVWGLAFKGDTDDTRESPALDVVKKLLDQGAKISAFDPVAMDQVKKYYKLNIEYMINMYDTLDNSEALLVLTEWQLFKNPDWNKVATKLKNKVIFDAKNLLDKQVLQKIGFEYFGMGR